MLHTLWDHYYVFIYGSVRALTDAHTLVNEQFCLLYRNRDRLFAEFAARV